MYNIDVAVSEGRPEEKKRFPTILASSILYLVTLFLMMGAVFFEDLGYGTNYYIFMAIFQVAVIGLPPLIYMVVNKIDIRDTIRLNRLSFPELMTVVGLAVSGYLLMIPINLLWQMFLSQFGTPYSPELPSMENISQYIAVIATTAVIPALLEEFLFRGVIQRGYESLGLKSSIVLTGVLFGVLHGNLSGLPVYILLGILLCYIVYRSNSIWAGMVFHFINNYISITMTFLLTNMSNLEGLEEAAEAPVETTAVIFTVLLMLFLVICIVFFFVGCLIGFNNITKNKDRLIAQKSNDGTGLKLVQLMPAFLALLFISVILIYEFWIMVTMG